MEQILMLRAKPRREGSLGLTGGGGPIIFFPEIASLILTLSESEAIHGR